ncbi:sialidase/neuraminidase family protein [Pedobacter metabolipauper]|uniref:BNR repeat protein n=1 Tax=Pedobacter metabolipauper TaxID=425513 RepID=A0A4R6SQQ4_9SPHI|nr:exo-alpha-sialidase [Pedobacter metabolipauper]TDQ07129.1 BNR repeat protein [Pedobacter metabolipauper]
MKQKWIGLFFSLMPAIVLGQAANPQYTNVIWDQLSLKQVAPLMGKSSANYARIVQLNNGHLICVYETRGGVECLTSVDLGNTWINPVVIASAIDGVNMAVPEIIELKDHSLLVSYNPRPRRSNAADTTKRFGIRTKKSYDQGKTWKDERLIYQAGTKFEDGCWEPVQIQLPSGEIQLYYSDEGIYTKTNEQNISIFRSYDNGLSWTKKPEIVSFRAGHRDGMPVPILLRGKDEIVFSIEDNASGQFKPSIIRNRLTQNWQKPVGANDAERSAAFIPGLPDTVYAGAPYLRQLKNGHTLLSYQSTMNRRHNWEQACMQVAIGDSDARNFKPVNTPFQIPLDKQGLWNSICILDDDTVIAITSTNAYTSSNSIWMIKGKLN